MVNLVLLGTVAVHEFGHVAAARWYGCESRAIIFEAESYPYSEIICGTLEHRVPIALAGPIIPVILAFLLFALGGTLMRPVAVLAFGFNLLASFRDLQDSGLSSTIAAGTTFIGLVSIVIGVYLLLRARFVGRDGSIQKEYHL